MKRILLCFVLLCLGLSACQTPRSGPALTGVWVNAGQYSEGRSFVETMTLREDGSVTVHLEYQGRDYATLDGRWSAEDGVLNVDFTDPGAKDRTYSYTLTEQSLSLSGSGKTVSYQRRD